MADRYWVGGTGSWNSTSFWSTSSGGASGASVPTSADNAIFNASSGGGVHYTVTVTDSSTCANLTFTPVAVDGVTQFSLGTGFVIAGTFSTSGTSGNRRAWFRSSVLGLMRDMQIATVGTVTDVDFRDVRVTGAGGTLSGTRIGNLRGCVGITFSTTKIVYWNLAGAQNWSANAWATTSAGTPSTDNFPLAQDTATFTNAGSVTGTITMNAAIPYTGTVDMSGRTSSMTLATTLFTIYGNWTNGSGTTLSGATALTYSGRNTQTITSAGKTFTQPLTVDSYGGSVELADALNIGTQILTVTNGTFDTKNYNVTATTLSSSNSNVRTITLGSSTLTLGASSFINFATSTNLTLNAGTSQITSTSTAPAFFGGSQTFYNLTFSATGFTTPASISGANIFNNVSVTSNASAGVVGFTVSDPQTISGTLTVAGATAIRRIFLRSNTLGTVRTLTVATLSATDCDFRDITIAGAAAGGSPTRAGDCGGNTGITFPVAKTVYWNLAGAQNWSATAWAPGSGGTPAANNFPLAQDTAVFDEALNSVTGTITIDAGWNIGTFNASARTSAMTLTTSTNAPVVYGNWTFGTGITQTSTTGTITFDGQVTQTITSNGVTFGCPVTVDSSTGTVQLADALVLDSARTLTLTSGTFDAVSYNVTAGGFDASVANGPLKMGSGTWTLSGTGTVWTINSGVVLYKGTANIVLSNTTTTTRIFSGSTQSYNKLTIGGATGISTLTLSGDGQFTELASTKTVAHTIALGTNTPTFGAWTVTGTVGNVVTVTGTATLTIAGARVSGVNYLALGTTAISTTSPGEFYAGVNSSGTGTGVILTAAPSATTRYWVGGAGTWTAASTTNWSTSSGGATGASVPTSADAVIFDTLSNATAYTVTCTATQLRCAALTFAGPLAGNVTWAGTAPLAIHGNFTLPATAMTRTYTGAITFSGSSTGRTITTNGVALSSSTTVNGVGCGWTLASALDGGTSGFVVTNGSVSLSTYSFSTGSFSTNNSNLTTINFGSSTITLASAAGINFGTTENDRVSLAFTAGTSQLNFSGGSQTLNGNNQTFYNVSFTSVALLAPTLTGVNTFNNLSFAGRTSSGIAAISVSGNQTISGTLTLSAGTDATMRNFVESNTIGTTRTLTCAAFAGTDADFRDITVAGAAAPASGTRLGDGKGNSGITFGVGANKYWNLAAGGNWGGAIGWATSSGGSPAINNFPLAQDTCFFEATGLNSAATVTVNASYNIGTINMSARTSNTMTLSLTNAANIYGNWINGTGTTTSSTGAMTFAGRGSQTITSAGVSSTHTIIIDSPSGSVTLQDAFATNRSLSGAVTLTSGTFNTNGYSVSLTGATGSFSGSSSNTRTLAIGASTWTIAGSGTAWNTTTSTNLTVTGTGTISLTSASGKTFAGGGASYAGITLDQGGAGALTISGNNTIANISNSYKVTGATTINMGQTTQTVGSFTASGEVGRVLLVQGTSSVVPCTLIYSGVGQATTATTDYLTLTGVRAYPLETTFYAGTNSTNNGSLGWLFEAGVSASSIYYGSTNVTSIFYGSTPVTAIYYGSAQVF